MSVVPNTYDMKAAHAARRVSLLEDLRAQDNLLNSSPLAIKFIGLQIVESLGYNLARKKPINSRARNLIKNI